MKSRKIRLHSRLFKASIEIDSWRFKLKHLPMKNICKNSKEHLLQVNNSIEQLSEQLSEQLHSSKLIVDHSVGACSILNHFESWFWTCWFRMRHSHCGFTSIAFANLINSWRARWMFQFEIYKQNVLSRRFGLKLSSKLLTQKFCQNHQTLKLFQSKHFDTIHFNEDYSSQRELLIANPEFWWL